MKRKPRINYQAQQAAQHVVLMQLVDAARASLQCSKARKPHRNAADWCCTEMLLESLEQIIQGIWDVRGMNESGELSPKDWELVTDFFDSLASAAPKLHIPLATMEEAAA